MVATDARWGASYTGNLLAAILELISEKTGTPSTFAIMNLSCIMAKSTPKSSYGNLFDVIRIGFLVEYVTVSSHSVAES